MTLAWRVDQRSRGFRAGIMGVVPNGLVGSIVAVTRGSEERQSVQVVLRAFNRAAG